MHDTTELGKYLDNLFREKGYPGLSLCVRGPEGVIFEKGYGYADMGQTRAADPDTVYGIASMSKSMTSLSCAILQAEGKLDFSDPVIGYFPDFSIPGTPKECVTLRHLATHTAGIPPIPPLEWSIAMNTPGRETKETLALRRSAPSKMASIGDIIAFIADSRAYTPLGAPGEYMSYSNDGYALLSYVADMAAGIPLERFLKERIFGPLGMTRSVLDLDGSEAVKLAGGNIADLFDTDEEGRLYADRIWSVLPPYRGCACVKSTARDMAKYYLMLAQKGRFEGKQVIPEEAAETLTGREFPETRRPFYCFGLSKRLKAGRVICEHSGGLHGISSYGGFIREEPGKPGYSMVALCNRGEVSVDAFVWACYNFILGLPLDADHYWAVPKSGKFSAPGAVTGKYISREAEPAYCVVTADGDGGLHAEYFGRNLDLHYCGGTLFSARSPEEPGTEQVTMEFLLREGQAWAVRCYTRILQRAE